MLTLLESLLDHCCSSITICFVYCFVVWFVSSTYYQKSPASCCFLWLSGSGKLQNLPVVHQMKLLSMYRNEISVSMTLDVGECRYVFVSLQKAAKFMLKNWEPRKFESFCSTSGNPVLPSLTFTPLTSLENVVQGQMQWTTMRKLNLHIPAVSGFPVEFVVGFWAICYTSPSTRKAILYSSWISTSYLSAVAKGACL